MGICRTVMITSFKGGVGKSTITANLGITLAQSGKRVLILDCDFNMRCLDLIMGLENAIVYDICDVVTRGVAFEKAVIQDSRSENLFFCAAPYSFDGEIEAGQFRSILSEAIERGGYEYVLIDTPGDFGMPLHLAASIADKALIVATHQPASIRAAERTGARLSAFHIEDRRLILNHFDASAVKKGVRPGVIDIIDRTYIQLIGVIPYDPALNILQERGALIDELKSNNSAAAFQNIAARLQGRSVPLFTGFRKIDRTVALK